MIRSIRIGNQRFPSYESYSDDYEDYEDYEAYAVDEAYDPDFDFSGYLLSKSVNTALTRKVKNDKRFSGNDSYETPNGARRLYGISVAKDDAPFAVAFVPGILVVVGSTRITVDASSSFNPKGRFWAGQFKRRRNYNARAKTTGFSAPGSAFWTVYNDLYSWLYDHFLEFRKDPDLFARNFNKYWKRVCAANGIQEIYSMGRKTKNKGSAAAKPRVSRASAKSHEVDREIDLDRVNQSYTRDPDEIFGPDSVAYKAAYKTDKKRTSGNPRLDRANVSYATGDGYLGQSVNYGTGYDNGYGYDGTGYGAVGYDNFNPERQSFESRRYRRLGRY